MKNLEIAVDETTWAILSKMADRSPGSEAVVASRLVESYCARERELRGWSDADLKGLSQYDLLAEPKARIQIDPSLPRRLDMRSRADVALWSLVGPIDVLANGKELRHVVSYDVGRGLVVAYVLEAATKQPKLDPITRDLQTFEVEGDVEIRARLRDIGKEN